MKFRSLGVVAAAAALVAAGATPALAATNPSDSCTATGNGGVSHGGCASTAARFGSADLESLPYLSTSALVSNCKTLPALFQQMVGMVPAEVFPVMVGSQSFSDPTSLANYMFHDIFGPDMSTCVAVLAADHATIANPGPEGPYDVYYTGGHGGNTTFAPGIPADLVVLFEMFGPQG